MRSASIAVTLASDCWQNPIVYQYSVKLNSQAAMVGNTVIGPECSTRRQRHGTAARLAATRNMPGKCLPPPTLQRIFHAVVRVITLIGVISIFTALATPSP